jgi:hypothetical protein
MMALTPRTAPRPRIPINTAWPKVIIVKAFLEKAKAASETLLSPANRRVNVTIETMGITRLIDSLWDSVTSL